MLPRLALPNVLLHIQHLRAEVGVYGLWFMVYYLRLRLQCLVFSVEG